MQQAKAGKWAAKEIALSEQAAPAVAHSLGVQHGRGKQKAELICHELTGREERRPWPDAAAAVRQFYSQIHFF